MPTLSACTAERLATFGRLALVVGHPGHELKVFGVLSEGKPWVHILTDGSGRHGISRLPSPENLIQMVGAQRGELFGVVSDRAIYEAILAPRPELFLQMAGRLAASLIEHEIDTVAGDATEGFNPTHDICRALIDAAVKIATRSTGKPIGNYEVRLTGWETNREPEHDSRCLHLRLDDELLSRKFAAAEQYQELKAEVERSLEHFGREYFRIECLRRASETAPPTVSDKPFYETWGEQQVAKGAYKSVIRFQQHMLPILGKIREHAASAVPDLSEHAPIVR